MANALKILTELEPAVGFTVSNSVGIEKGDLLELADPMTVAKVTGAGPRVIGFAAEEKIANDGKTEIGVYMRAIVKATSGGTITAGDVCKAESGTNELLKGTTSESDTVIFAVAFEDLTDGQTGKFLFNAGIGGTPNS